MLAPASIVLTTLFAGALLYAGLQSFGYAPIYGINEFPTTRHYQALFASPGFWWSAFYSFYYAVVPTIAGLVISLALALALRNRFRGKRLVHYVYKLPLMIPYLVGVGLTILVWSNGGIAARLLHAAGLIETTSDFPRLLRTHAGWGIMLVYLWKQVPFMTLAISAVLLGLGRETEEAAATLGAGKWQTFWHVTLPQLGPGIASATLIVFAFNFGAFEVPFILGGGFPETLPVEAWRAFGDADYARRLDAMAILMIVSTVSAAILLPSLMLYRRFERQRGRR